LIDNSISPNDVKLFSGTFDTVLQAIEYIQAQSYVLTANKHRDSFYSRE
jgi:hypothetical protein